jgi:hypothetical protein
VIGTMPEVIETRARMVSAYREGLVALLEDATHTIAELQEQVERDAEESVADEASKTKRDRAVEADLLAIPDVPVITRRDVDEALHAIFSQPVPAPDATWAEVRTGATVIVWAICPRCSIAQPITVTIHPELLIDDTGSELRVKAKSKGRTHLCGQLPLPVGDEADGQLELDGIEVGEGEETEIAAEGEEELPEVVQVEPDAHAQPCVRDQAGCATHRAVWPAEAKYCWGSAKAVLPGVGDAVVDGGTKYRIREVNAVGSVAMALLSAAGPSWKKTPVIVQADAHQLEWDKVAAVWRGPTWAVPA